MTGMDDTPQARIRWFHLTPDRLVIGLLAVEVLLWLWERFGWLGWHKGYAVLTAVATVGVAMLLMLFWCAQRGFDGCLVRTFLQSWCMSILRVRDLTPMRPFGKSGD